MRQLTVDVVKAIMALPDDDDRFWTAPEIVQRYLGKGAIGTAKYVQLRKAVYHLGWRNGLTVAPDNAVRDERGKVKRGPKNKILLFAAKHPAFKSAKWKSLVEPWVAHEAREPETESEETQTRPLHKWRTTGLLAATGLVPLFILGFTLDIVKESLAINHKLGPQKALAYLTSAGEGGLDSYFLTGWYHYRDMDYDQAREIAENILEKRQAQEIFKARAHFLLCSIEIEHGRYQQAETHYERAKELYLNINNEIGLARLSLEKARILRREGAFEEALALIVEAEGLLGENKEVLLQYTKVYYDLGDFPLSMDFAKLLAKCGDKSREAYAYLHLGHCALALGDLKGSLFYLWNADALIEDMGSERLRHFAMVQRIFLAKCLDIDVTQYRQRLVAWAEQQEEALILKQLALIKALPCSPRLNFQEEDH